MLGFAIVDTQPAADATAVWLTTRLEGAQVNHTNAVVVGHDDDRYEKKIRALTADRAVVLTEGTTPPLPFEHALRLDAFDGFKDETTAHQQRIRAAVSEYAARTKSNTLVIPDFPTKRPMLKIDPRDEPQYRALSVANYIAAVWSEWLSSDEQRVRRAVNPRTAKAPWIMPEALGSPDLAEFPPLFADLVQPEPIKQCSTT